MWNKLIKLWILVALVCTCGFVSHAPVFAKIKTSDWITTHVDSLTFKDDAYLKKHYYKHGRQMGYASPKAYLAGARRVISDSDVLTKREKEDGDWIFYVKKTNEIVFVSKNPYIRTYFKPSLGIQYYYRQ